MVGIFHGLRVPLCPVGDPETGSIPAAPGFFLLIIAWPFFRQSGTGDQPAFFGQLGLGQLLESHCLLAFAGADGRLRSFGSSGWRWTGAQPFYGATTRTID